MGTKRSRLGLALAALIGSSFGACRSADDDKCEVVCHCEDQVQYRGAGFCNRENFACSSGVDECESLCADNGGLAELCSYVEDQAVGHTAPSIVCPGIDPEGSNCEPKVDCAVSSESSGADGLWLALILGGLAVRRRRR